MWGCAWPGCKMLYYNRTELDVHFNRHHIRARLELADVSVAACILVGMSK